LNCIKMTKCLALLLACSVATSLAVPVTDLDQFVEDLNRNLIPNNQWVAGKNFESLEDVLPLLGAWLEDPETLKEREYREGSLEALENFAAPESFDARTAWSQCKSIATIWDQANCGSCWAVAAAGAISDRICIHNNKQVMVSAEQLMDCCWECGNGCNGGYILAAWSYFKYHGLVTGGGHGQNTCQPYSLPKCDHHVKGPYGPCPNPIRTPSCKRHCTNEAYNKDFSEDNHKGSSSYGVRMSEEAIMEEIMTNGPVEAGFTVFEDFPQYKSGVYQHTSGGALGGHAIRIIGWGVENGVKYWLVANSWNNYWGDNGTFKIRKGVNECGIEGQVAAGLPK